jgi:hypothetical protein
VDLVDPERELRQRVDIGCHREPVEMLSLPREQANIKLLGTEIAPSVQHVKRASLVLRRLVNTTERFTNGALLPGSPLQVSRS